MVTGASSGIGRASVAALVEAGFAVIATVRKQADADALAAEHGDAVSTLLVDLIDQDAVRSAGESVVGAGPLFALVNNAGTAVPGPLEHQPIDDLRRQLEINLVGQVLMTQVMLPALRRSAEESGDARIVMIGSIGGRVTGPDARGISGIQARDGRCVRCVPGRAGALGDSRRADRTGGHRHADLGPWGRYRQLDGRALRPKSVHATRPRSRERVGWLAAGRRRVSRPVSLPGRSCVRSPTSGRPPVSWSVEMRR